MKNEKLQFKIQGFLFPLMVRILAPKILLISLVSLSNESMLSRLIWPESLKSPNQNLLSFADFKEWFRKFVKSFRVPDACASIILAPTEVALLKS